MDSPTGVRKCASKAKQSGAAAQRSMKEKEKEGKRERQREERGWTDHLQSERVFWGLEIELGITALHTSMDVVLSCIGASAKRRFA